MLLSMKPALNGLVEKVTFLFADIGVQGSNYGSWWMFMILLSTFCPLKCAYIFSAEPGKCKADETASKYKGTYKWLLTNPTEMAQTRCLKNEAENATRIWYVLAKF